MIIDATNFFQNSPKHKAIFETLLLSNSNNFTNFLESLSLKFTDDASLNIWLLSTLSERTIHNPLYKYFCFIKVIEELYVKNSAYCFLIEEYWLKRYFIQYMPEIKMVYRSRKNPIKLFFIVRLKLAYYFFLKIAQIFIAKFCIQKIHFKNTEITLVERFALPNFYAKDRYFTGIEEHAPRNINLVFCPSLVHTNIRGSFSAFKEMEKSITVFLFKEHYLLVRDIIYSFYSSLSLKKIIKRNNSLNEVERILLLGSYNKIISFSSSIEAFINYQFINRIKNLNVSKFINWWEGQLVDRGFALGIKSLKKQIVLRHYLGFIPKANDFQVHPTNFECNYSLCSKEFYLLGSIYKESFKLNNSELKIHAAPAFRFSQVHTLNIQDSNKLDTSKALVGLPMDESESIEILNCIQGSLKSEHARIIKLYVKFHPASKSKLIKESTLFNKFFIDTNSSIYDQNFSIFISGSSSLVFEAALTGSIVFVYEKDFKNTYLQRYFDQLPNVFIFSSSDELLSLLDQSDNLINLIDTELDILKPKFFSKSSKLLTNGILS